MQYQSGNDWIDTKTPKQTIFRICDVLRLLIWIESFLIRVQSSRRIFKNTKLEKAQVITVHDLILNQL